MHEQSPDSNRSLVDRAYRVGAIMLAGASIFSFANSLVNYSDYKQDETAAVSAQTAGDQYFKGQAAAEVQAGHHNFEVDLADGAALAVLSGAWYGLSRTKPRPNQASIS